MYGKTMEYVKKKLDEMYYLEHGTSRQAAHPFMDRTLHGAESRVVSAMEDEIGKVAGE